MEEYWRWFMYQTKILPEQRVKCLEYFETPENMFIAPAAKVEKAEFLSEAAREELLRTRTAGELSREEKELQEKEIDFYSMEHPAYPARLREIPHAPCGLFVKGRLPQFEKGKKKVQAAAIFRSLRQMEMRLHWKDIRQSFWRYDLKQLRFLSRVSQTCCFLSDDVRIP